MRKKLEAKQIQNPETVMYHLINDYVSGKLDARRFLYRAQVVAVDALGGQFETDPQNPKHTIRGRIITDGYNASTHVDDLPLFWPLSPHQRVPIKEGEHVYVMFEDEERQHGLWFGRIPHQLDFDSKNYAEGTAPYTANSENVTSDISIDQSVAGAARALDPTTPSDEFTVEDVPEFRARIGDHVIEGSNNTIIVLGRDRPTDSDSGKSDQAGSIDIVAGRANPEDMSDDDKSRVYVSMKTDVDANMGVGDQGAPGTSGVGPVAAIGVKSDEIRIVARTGMKIVVTGGDLVLEGQNIVIGNGATEHGVLGDTLKSLLTQLCDAISNIVVNTPAGPSSPPIVNKAQVDAVSQQLSTALSQTVVVKG